MGVFGLFKKKNKGEKNQEAVQPLDNGRLLSSTPSADAPTPPPEGNYEVKEQGTEGIGESQITNYKLTAELSLRAEQSEARQVDLQPSAPAEASQFSILNSQLPTTGGHPQKKGFFAKLRAGLRKTKEAITYKISKLFTGGVLKDDFYEELEEILLSADVGAECTETILDELRAVIDKRRLRKEDEVRAALKEIMTGILSENESEPYEFPLVITVIGVNGTGKTTSIGKLAHMFRAQKKSVTIAAGDTFRAAAAEQLKTWAERADAKIIAQGEGGDPAAVVYDALKSVKSKGTDVLIIDTAGRLHNKVNLMEELKKINRVVEREYPEADRRNLIVLDAVTGQNALSQVELFDEAVGLDGIILTKLDGTAKGGVILSLCREFSVPVVYVGVGEGVDDLQPFDAEEFAEALFTE